MTQTKSRPRGSRTKKSDKGKRPGRQNNDQDTRRLQYPESGLADYEEAAGFLKISRRTLERRVKAGDFSPIKQSPRCVRLRWEDLRSYKGKPLS